MGTRSYPFKKTQRHSKNLFVSPAFFIFKDFECTAKENKHIDKTSAKEVNKETINNITWRFQKKGMIIDKSFHISNIIEKSTLFSKSMQDSSQKS